jgi:sugar lactone lactonase YvrE
MKNARNMVNAFSLLLLITIPMLAWADDGDAFPQGATFSTLITTAQYNIEGMTGDNRGNLYTAGRDAKGSVCPVARTSIENPSLVVVGFIPPLEVFGCSPRGLAFDHAGKLYVTNRNRIYSFFPDAENPPVADLFASDVPGTDGVAFDRADNLWTGDGTTGLGRVWKITPHGAVTEMFRVQPVTNDVTTQPSLPEAGVGRAVVTSPGTSISFPVGGGIVFGNQVVANGLAFDRDHNLLVADTTRGAIWKVSFDLAGNLSSRTGCDTTFTPNTLCYENLFVIHPLLEGADGIAVDQGGNIWVSVGERNAIVGVTRKGKVIEVFRNAPGAVTRRRNLGPLEFPTSPFLSDSRFCTANSDENRRDNWHNEGGEISPFFERGKISCIDQTLFTRGMPLPVR